MQKAQDDADRKKEDFKKGRLFGISGRELFEFDPNLIIETNDADDADQVRSIAVFNTRASVLRELCFQVVSFNLA